MEVPYLTYGGGQSTAGQAEPMRTKALQFAIAKIFLMLCT
jgi:hypothetical protein